MEISYHYSKSFVSDFSGYSGTIVCSEILKKVKYFLLVIRGVKLQFRMQRR